jgi:hypothetical protein
MEKTTQVLQLDTTLSHKIADSSLPVRTWNR